MNIRTERMNFQRVSPVKFNPSTDKSVANKPDFDSQSANEHLGNQEYAISRGSLDSMVEGLNQTLEQVEKGLQFEIHEDTERIMVRVIDRNRDDEVIREIPPEQILDMVAQIREMIGVLMDQKV